MPAHIMITASLHVDYHKRKHFFVETGDGLDKRGEKGLGIKSGYAGQGLFLVCGRRHCDSARNLRLIPGGQRPEDQTGGEAAGPFR